MGDKKQDVLQALRDWLLEAWLDSIEWDMAALLEAVERGIPEDWAMAIERQSGGRVSAKSWPHLIRSPRIAGKVVRAFYSEPAKVDLAGVDTSRWSTGAKIGASIARRSGQAQSILRKQGITVSAVHREVQGIATSLKHQGKPADARAWDYTRSSVSAWFASGDKARGIPEEIADYLALKYGVPKTAWAKVLQKA